LQKGISNATKQNLSQPRRNKMREYITKKIIGGVVFALAVFGTTILAVAISGTITTWTTGQVLKRSDLNTTITSLKTAIEGIPNWTKNGTSAYYTDGNVGIGTTAPNQKLSINGGIGFANASDSDKKLYSPVDGTLEWMTNSLAGTRGFAISNQGTQIVHLNISGSSYLNGGSVGIGTTTPSQLLTVNGNAGNTTGVWVNNSDERLKKNILPLGNYLEKLTELRPVTFEWKDPKKLNAKEGKHIGFIAQEVEKVFPYWVDTDKSGMKWLSMEGVNAAFVQSFKEVALRLRSTSEKLSLLEESNEKLKIENESLKKKIVSFETEVKTIHELFQKAANEKKVIALEEDNKRLREDMARLRGTLEDRLRAIENLQMARK